MSKKTLRPSCLIVINGNGVWMSSKDITVLPVFVKSCHLFEQLKRGSYGRKHR